MHVFFDIRVLSVSYALLLSVCFLLLMEQTQRLESSEESPRTPEKKYLGRIPRPDFEDGRSPPPRRLKRQSATADIDLVQERSPGSSDYRELQEAVKYSQQDFPIDISSESDQGEKAFALAMNNVITFDRSIPPDVLWYLSQWCITPDEQIGILRSAASYLSRTNGHVNKRGKYKRPNSKK